MVQTTAQPAERGFSVEVRVQADAFDGEVSSATASESWAVRAAVLAAVLVIAGIYTGVHIGRG